MIIFESHKKKRKAITEMTREYNKRIDTAIATLKPNLAFFGILTSAELVSV